MKDWWLILAAFTLSIAQAYSSYLLHNDLIQQEIVQWFISVIYLPLYIILLFIGVFLEGVVGMHVLKGGGIFPYLNDGLWCVSIIILLPLNLWFCRLYARFRKRI
ncbi:hypothetical protein [Vibrio gallaecicus]|uniref:Uncharacterized protein n=1 Tax=Vibrio gallaecicus TaxID=552386 RepID=A0ABV4NGK1_9VIBR